MREPKVIIVANRLPVRVQIRKDNWKLIESEGGLATGLSSIYQSKRNIWIGWPGVVLKDGQMKKTISKDLESQRLKPIWLSQKEVNSYYEGFSNETLWPLFHYFASFAKFKHSDWEAYQQVNQRFADKVIELSNDGDTIWIHDYQLLLVPQMVRVKKPKLSIGFFQHIPFPSYELFRMLPWREALLEGILGADLIGFHTYDDERHFLSSVSRILEVPVKGNEITFKERTLVVDAFPMGIDYEKYRQAVLKPKTKSFQNQIKEMTNGKKLMLSIDRLDYSKGIVNRLLAYREFLQQHPENREDLLFFQLIVPSRDKVQQYAELKEEINSLVSEINAQFGTLTWQPIFYFYRSFPLEMIAALYAAADIALVAPLRDGMNLVCKEYIACSVHQDGVLILSEFAGASKELRDAILINPRDQRQVAKAIFSALTMPLEEKKRRMEAMQNIIQKFNIHHWVEIFMNRLKEVKEKQIIMTAKWFNETKQKELIQLYQKSKKRLFLIDYDGTLVSFQNDPLKAIPDTRLKEMIYALCEQPNNTFVLISGRKKETLEEWFNYPQINLIAEHGLWQKQAGGEWQSAASLDVEWKKSIRPILERYEMITPGSFIEEKSASLAWHYRNLEAGLGDKRAQEIKEKLNIIIGAFELQILEGNKVIEVKSIFINKGKAAFEFLKEVHPDWIVAIGDDVTDEDTFKEMPDDALTIKVGNSPSKAAFFVRNVQEVKSFLKKLI